MGRWGDGEWDKMGWGREERFLQLVVRNPILQLSCLKSPCAPACLPHAHVALRKT